MKRLVESGNEANNETLGGVCMGTRLTMKRLVESGNEANIVIE